MVKPEDRGSYYCVAENSEGRVKSPDALLNLAGRLLHIVIAFTGLHHHAKKHSTPYCCVVMFSTMVIA